MILIIAVVAFSVAFAVLVIAVLRWITRHADAVADFLLDTIIASPWIVFFIILFFVMAGLAGVIGMLLWPVTVVIALMVLARYRETERRALAALLAVAVEKGIPLSATSRAFAQDCHGGVARRARRLADMLERGVPLPVALESSRVRLPTDAQVAFAMGYEGGGLEAAVADTTSAAVQVDPISRDITGKVAYLAAIVVYATGIVSFLLYRIVPQYIKIFEDFEIELPATTGFVIWIGNAFVGNPWVTSCSYLFVFAVVWLVLGHYVGALRWEPPLVRRLWRRLDQAVVLRSLAQAVDQRRSLPSAIDALARLYPKRHIRRRLAAAAQRVSGGGDWCESLLAAGLVRPAEVGVLKAAQRVGNLAWALREMADRNVRTFATRMSALLAVVFPLVLLAIGAVIFLISAGMFFPLVDIIQSML